MTSVHVKQFDSSAEGAFLTWDCLQFKDKFIFLYLFFQPTCDVIALLSAKTWSLQIISLVCIVYDVYEFNKDTIAA